MRTRLSVLVVAFGLGVIGCAWPLRSADAAPVLAGRWMLTLPTVSDNPLLILSIDEQQGHADARIVAAQKFIVDPQIADVKQTADSLRFEMTSKSDSDVFVGSIPREGANEPILGTFRFRSGLYPAARAHGG